MSLAGRLTGPATVTRATAKPFPAVDAGPDDDYEIVGGVGHQLLGTAPTATSVLYSVVSKPEGASVGFSAPDALDSLVDVFGEDATAEGDIVIRLTISDGTFTVHDEFTLSVTYTPA